MKRVGTKLSKGIRYGYISHDPNYCIEAGECTYLFSVKNIAKDYKVCSIRVTAESYNPQDVDLKLKYKNVVNYGQFLNYEINPLSNKLIQPFLRSLTIRLMSISGDADLFVSMVHAAPNHENSIFMSRRNNFIDEIILTDDGDDNFLDRSIFFSVYGNSLSSIYIEFEYTFRGSFNVYSENAV